MEIKAHKSIRRLVFFQGEKQKKKKENQSDFFFSPSTVFVSWFEKKNTNFSSGNDLLNILGTSTLGPETTLWV